MTSQHIRIRRDSDLPLTGDVRALVDGARALQELAVKVKDVMDQMASGSDWSALGTELGLDATDAQTVYNLVTAVMDEVSTSSDYNNLIDRVG